MPTVLIVDDEEMWAKLICDACAREGYHFVVIHNGQRGLEVARQILPDAIVLDMWFKGQSLQGEQILYALVRDPLTQNIPILIHSVKGLDPQLRARLSRISQAHIVPRPQGDPKHYLEFGSDDNLEEVVNRLAAILKDHMRSSTIYYRGHRLHIEQDCRHVWRDDYRIKLPPREASILCLLNRHRGKFLDPHEIARALGMQQGYYENSIREAISQMRQKMEPDPGRPIFLINEKPYGYCLTEGEAPPLSSDSPINFSSSHRHENTHIS